MIENKITSNNKINSNTQKKAKTKRRSLKTNNNPNNSNKNNSDIKTIIGRSKSRKKNLIKILTSDINKEKDKIEETGK